MKIVNIASYRFVELTDLPSWQSKLLTVCQAQALKGTVILSSEGININLSGEPHGIEAFTCYLTEFSPFSGMAFKESFSETHAFQRMIVKIRDKLIPGPTPNMADFQPKYISPETFKQWLDEKRDIAILDTRNAFEYEIGTFEGAFDLNITNFSEFDEKATRLEPGLKEKPLVIFCTGGIRCEKAAPLLEKQGFNHVYQLEGGILDYFTHCGGTHYQGTCFVFDERSTLDSQLNAVRHPEEANLPMVE